MRSTLAELGFDVPKQDYGFGTDVQEDAEISAGNRDGQLSDHVRGMSTDDEVVYQLVSRWLAETDQSLAVREIHGPSSSSSRKRKRDEQEEGIERSRHQPVRSTQRTSSREMMPPPPIQMKQRREKPIQASQIPASRTTQRLETSGGVPNVPNLRYPLKETQDLTQPIVQIREMSRSPIAPRPAAIERPYAEHEYQMGGSITHGSREHYNTKDRGLTSSFGESHGPVIDRPTYTSQRTGRPMVERNDHFDHTKERVRQQDQLQHIRQPLRPIHMNSSGAHTPAHSTYRHANLGPISTPFKTREPTAGSVSSPFFQRDDIKSRISPIRPPPPRGKNVTEAHTRHESQPIATGTSQWLYENHGPSTAQDWSRSSRQLQPSSHDKYSGSAPFTATIPYRNFTAASQAPDEFHRRQDSEAYAFSSQRPLAERQQFPASRGRITLPPSQSSAQDYELSSIRGLRGGYAQQVNGFSAYRDSGYTGSRPLFSASSRRSVRR